MTHTQDKATKRYNKYSHDTKTLTYQCDKVTPHSPVDVHKGILRHQTKDTTNTARQEGKNTGQRGPGDNRYVPQHEFKHHR